MKIRGAKRLTWNAPPDTGVVGYKIYAGDAGVTDFLAKADLKPEEGGLAPYDSTTELFWDTHGLAEGSWQFAVCSYDEEDNESDPYQSSAWTSVPLDLTAPQPPSNGSVVSSPG